MQVVPRFCGNAQNGVGLSQPARDQPLEDASCGAHAILREMPHSTSDRQQIVASNHVSRMRECRHVHRIRVVAQMHDICFRSSAPQLPAEEQELIHISQPLEKGRAFCDAVPQHRRRLEQTHLMPTGAQPCLHHGGIQLHAILAVRHIVANQQYLHRGSHQAEIESGKAIGSNDSTVSLHRMVTPDEWNRTAPHATGGIPLKHRRRSALFQNLQKIAAITTLYQGGSQCFKLLR